ncbi:MAG: hypothetical protein IKY83_13465 [Proteobacteria bacterium]|nr:hypothetical protein [Pseudomonadota bacterium]
MNRKLFLTVMISSLSAVLFSASAFADVAPLCGLGGGGNRLDNWCQDNQYHLTKNGCIDTCQNSEYCKVYQVEGKNIFGGFWRFGDTPLDSCEEACNYEKDKCDVDDQDCLSRFIPEEIDCSILTDEEDQKWCNQYCAQSILNSECGKTCLKDGVKHAYLYELDGEKQFGEIEGLECTTEDGYAYQYCASICSDDYYCASIPLKYETKWSVFGALLTFFTVLCGMVLVIVNRKRKDENP